MMQHLNSGDSSIIDDVIVVSSGVLHKASRSVSVDTDALIVSSCDNVSAIKFDLPGL